MKDYEVNLRRALCQAPAPDLRQLMLEPVEKLKEHDAITAPPKKNFFIHYWKPVISACAACACLFVVFAGWLVQNNRTDSYIELDINPSMELAVNQKDQVLKLEGMNEDARSIIKHLNWHKKDIDDVMDDILKEMLQAGYFKDAENMILLSVDNKDDQRAEALMNRLEKQMQNYLNSRDVHPTIIRQLIRGNNEQRNLAKAHEMSMGKLYLIHEIMGLESSYAFDQLADLSIKELTDLYERLKSTPETTPETEDAKPEPAAPSEKEKNSPVPAQKKNTAPKKPDRSRTGNADENDDDEDGGEPEYDEPDDDDDSDDNDEDEDED